MLPKNLSVSVVILTYNRCEDLRRCLNSLMKQSYKNFEILVIDNGSTDCSPDVLKSYAVRVIINLTKKLSYLFNLAWKNTTGDYIVYIADDVELHHDWLKYALETFREYSEIGAVGGPIISKCKQEMHLLYEEAKQSKLLSFLAHVYERIVMEGKLLEPGILAESGAYSMGASLEPSLKLRSPIFVDLLTTSAMVVKRQVFQKIGGFDENFYFNHADGDLFVRMKKAGYRLMFNPKVIASHYVRLGPSRDPYYIARDTGYFLAKNIRPKTLHRWLGFILNVIYLNAYWFHKFLKTGEIRQLKGIRAFLTGIVEYLKRGHPNRSQIY